MKNRILLFEQFLCEVYKRSEFQKVMMTRSEDIDDSLITGPGYSPEKYWTIIVNKDEPTTVPKDLPVLNYDTKTLQKMIKAGAIRDNQVYNKREAKYKVASKSSFYAAHAKSDYIIPTVLDPKDIQKLQFPVVAKPDSNHSGLGIKVFEKPEDMDKVDLSKFTSFSEKIKIKEEHRFFIWRSEVIQWTEREPMDEGTKDIAKKAADKETNFSYILRNETPGPEFLKCIAYFGDYHSDLDFYAVDIAKTEDNKIYVFELNSEPGALFGVMALVYERIYEDWYETQLSVETTEMLKKFRQEDIKQNNKENPNFKVKK